MKTIIKSLAITAIAIMMLVAFSSCAGNEVTLKINDEGVITQVTAKTGQKIKDILENAEISLGDKDEADPSADSKLTEDTEQIVIKRYAKVSVVKGNNKKEVELTGGTVEDAIKSAGFSLADGEIADTDLKSVLKDGMTITISKGVTVSLTVDGKTDKVTAAVGTTVKELLDLQEVDLGKDDVCTEKLDVQLKDGMEIAVKRVEYKEETVKETVEFETEKEYSSSLDDGKSQVKQDGVNGEKEVTYKVKFVDGEEISREVITEKVIKEAVSKIVVYGTKGASQSGSSQGGDNSGSGGKTVVSKTPVYNCDGSNHGYYEIVYSDGSTEYVEF